MGDLLEFTVEDFVRDEGHRVPAGVAAANGRHLNDKVEHLAHFVSALKTAKKVKMRFLTMLPSTCCPTSRR